MEKSVWWNEEIYKYKKLSCKCQITLSLSRTLLLLLLLLKRTVSEFYIITLSAFNFFVIVVFVVTLPIIIAC